MKTTIYQLFVRHFGNLKTSGREGGDIEENGCGKFADITDSALLEIKNLGFTHVWLTGILEHASGTAYPDRPADDAKVLKGIAGSPYAVRDYFDVSPDLAVNVEKRIDEFEELIKRCHKARLLVLIDFIPNHVARSYASDVRPHESFGKDDNVKAFCNLDNSFYYLQGDQPLELPGGIYNAETHPRVTGNNAANHRPTKDDWYETVKLNYGYDFTNREKLFSGDQIPKTWSLMDSILSYWQQLGVDGFRCDMAHMVPMEFWKWAVDRARDRSANVYFLAEAYAGDMMRVTDGNVLKELLSSGFDEVYDSSSYDLVKGIYEDGKWANDLDNLLWDLERLHKMTRYMENHDEVRIASPQHWGGHGAKIGMAVSGFLFGIGAGGCLFYNGQEVGETAEGAKGYSGDDGKTSIFDYVALPELQKWVNGHTYDGKNLSEEQAELRGWYGRWINVLQAPAFSKGETYGLNYFNKDNPNYGRLDNEYVSGRWLYGFLRYDKKSDEAYLVMINFHPTVTMLNLDIWFSKDARKWLGNYDYESLELEKLLPCEVMTYCMKHAKESE